MAMLEKIKINELRLPGIDDTVKINKMKALLEKERSAEMATENNHR